MKIYSSLRYTTLAGAVCLGAASLPLAAGAVDISGDANGVIAEKLPKKAESWSIHGPDGIYLQSTTALISDDTSLPDGSYTYEVIGPLRGKDIRISRAKLKLNQGRPDTAMPKGVPTGVTETGYFRIVDGFVVIDDGAEE